MTKLHIPKVIGHRGAKAYAPENTLVSIHTVADIGAKWVELDIKLTKDSVPIIFHDEDLERCTNGSGKVAETDYATIKELDAGSWFSESFIGAKIPTLEEAIEVMIQRNLGFNLELKPCPGREEETAEIALDIASRVWPEDELPILISSYSHVSLEAAMNMIPAWSRGLLMDTYIENWVDIANHLNVSTLNIEDNPEMMPHVEEYLEDSRPKIVNTVNDPRRALEFFDMGVSGVFTDVPDLILEELDEEDE